MDTGLRAGFVAVKDKKSLNAVFTPAIFGRGLGAKLFSFAINELKADKIDVNENTRALRLYQKFGFEVFKRISKDGSSRDYPLLKMKLK